MEKRALAVACCGGSAFLDMYATQPLLPELRHVFGAGEAAVGATISALTFACALAAPFVGSLADAIGRKRVIVSAILGLALVTLGAASATTLPALVAWRFVQGLFMPAVFAVTVAYIAEEFPAGERGGAMGLYIGGNVLGGFLGRYIAALVAERYGWRSAFVALGMLNLAGAALVGATLPSARSFLRATRAGDAIAAMARFVRDPQMLLTYVAGGGILFTLVAAFTFATYHLAAPPYALGTIALGNVFFVYLVGVIATPLAGRAIDAAGHRAVMLGAVAVSVAGMLLTLVPALIAIVAGLGLVSTGVFASQAASQGFIGVIARERRSTAAALYLTVYYAGGGLGAIVPAAVWSRGGWPATVALIVAVQCVTAFAAFGWRGVNTPVTGGLTARQAGRAHPP